jgi:hypothetical protein
MRRLALVAMGVCLAGSSGLAQDPVKVSPKVYHVVMEARRRVVYRARSAPPGTEHERQAAGLHPIK